MVDLGRKAQRNPMAVGVSVFAAAMLMMSGLAQALTGIAALIDDAFLVRVGNYIYEFDATTWGWIHLLLGAAFVAVGVFILIGKPWAYLVGIVIAVLNGLLNFCGCRSLPSGPSSSLRSMCWSSGRSPPPEAILRA